MDEMAWRPGVVPAVCGNGHLSYPHPVRYLLSGHGRLTVGTDVKAGTCPACGTDRVIQAGEYEAHLDGSVHRAGARTAYC